MCFSITLLILYAILRLLLEIKPDFVKMYRPYFTYFLRIDYLYVCIHLFSLFNFAFPSHYFLSRTVQTTKNRM